MVWYAMVTLLQSHVIQLNWVWLQIMHSSNPNYMSRQLSFPYCHCYHCCCSTCTILDRHSVLVIYPYPHIYHHNVILQSTALHQHVVSALGMHHMFPKTMDNIVVLTFDYHHHSKICTHTLGVTPAIELVYLPILMGE